MKCRICGYKNLGGSVYCQECGSRLGVKGGAAEKGKMRKKVQGVYEEIREGIDDVIFVPKKKKSFVQSFLYGYPFMSWLLTLVIFLIISFLLFTGSDSGVFVLILIVDVLLGFWYFVVALVFAYRENRLVTYVYMGVCTVVFFLILRSLPDAPIQTHDSAGVTADGVVDVSRLNITEPEIHYDNSGEAYFTGVLHNDNSVAVRNVEVRLDFYRDKEMKKHFDTRRVLIDSGAEARGAFSFEVPLYIYPDGQYWWVYRFEGLDR